MSQKDTSADAPPLITFDADGHLSNGAVACIADGEMRVLGAEEASALAHVDACDACGRRVGEAALGSMALSVAMSVAMGDPQRVPQTPPITLAAGARMVRAPGVPSSRRARRPVPWVAIAAALMVATLAAGPGLLETARGLHGTIAEILAVAPFMGRVVLSVVRAPWWDRPILLAVQMISAVTLMAVGVRIARETSRARAVQEGVAG